MATKQKKKATKKTKARKQTAQAVTPYRSEYVDYACEQVEELVKMLYPKLKGRELYSRMQSVVSVLLENPTPAYVTITPAKESNKHPWVYFWDSHLLESDRSYATADKARASAKKAHNLFIKEEGVPRMVILDDVQDVTD